MDLIKLVDQLMQFESDEMAEEDIPNFFQRLIDTGVIWELQGYYGRMAMDLAGQGLVTIP